ncbi:MAG: hypothetical protein JWM97_2261, partial [Phycisphaerales bacterium]|nr:hypothetical protein [Phycisphaerales bacterium]
MTVCPAFLELRSGFIYRDDLFP